MHLGSRALFWTGRQPRHAYSSCRACPAALIHLTSAGAAVGVCKACSSRDVAAAGAGKLAHYQQQFAKDLDPASAAAPQTLGEMTERLKASCTGWKRARISCGQLSAGACHLLCATYL